MPNKTIQTTHLFSYIVTVLLTCYLSDNKHLFINNTKMLCHINCKNQLEILEALIIIENQTNIYKIEFNLGANILNIFNK